jgi:hypothetical protein
MSLSLPTYLHTYVRMWRKSLLCTRDLVSALFVLCIIIQLAICYSRLYEWQFRKKQLKTSLKEHRRKCQEIGSSEGSLYFRISFYTQVTLVLSRFAYVVKYVFQITRWKKYKSSTYAQRVALTTFYVAWSHKYFDRLTHKVEKDFQTFLKAL